MQKLLRLKHLVVSLSLFCGLILLTCSAPIRQGEIENTAIDSLTMAWVLAEIDDVTWAADTIKSLDTDSFVPVTQGVRSWDCENVAALDSAQNAADRHDYQGKRRCQERNREILKKHEGHAISRSWGQYAVYCAGGTTCPICYECSVCGRFDLYEYIPLERVEIHCGNRVWRIRR